MFSALSLGCSAASWTCFAAQCAGQVCCSVASCFGCSRPSALAAKILYVLIFLLSAVLAVLMRYYAEPSLASWVPQISRACGVGLTSCFGAQAVYRISLALAAFFALMCALTALVPVTHFGGWLAKLLLYVLLLGLTLLVPDTNMLQFAEAARVFSVMFLLSQVVLLIDLVYTAHYALLRKMDARDEELSAAGWAPGVLSNCWKVLYFFKAVGLLVGSLVVLGLLVHWFGNACPLNNFFIAQTLAVGVALTALSVAPAVNRGLLPPAAVLAYNTFLVYSAITNNPDSTCNLFARTENQSQASVVIGLIVAVVSVTYMAVSSASKMESALVIDRAPVVKQDSPLGAAGAAKDWGSGARGGLSSSSYQAGGDQEAGFAAAEGGAADAPAGGRWEAPIFHATMFLAGCYVAMMASNWGSPSATTAPSGSPELSTASMWARMASQFLTELAFLCACEKPPPLAPRPRSRARPRTLTPHPRAPPRRVPPRAHRVQEPPIRGRLPRPPPELWRPWGLKGVAEGPLGKGKTCAYFSSRPPPPPPHPSLSLTTAAL